MAAAASLLLAAACSAGGELPEGNAFVHGLVSAQRQREDAVSRYTYDLTEAREELDAEGRVRRRETTSYEVFHVKGRPVRRRVARNGRPLSEKEGAKEERRAGELAEALRSGRAVREEPGVRLSRILGRYDFVAAGREDMEGRCSVFFDFSARAGDFDIERDGLLKRLAGRLWVDEEERAVVRISLRNTGGMRFALGIGATVKSFSFEAEFRRLEEGVWLPKEVKAFVAGKKLLFKSFRVRTKSTYQSFRRFDVDVEETVRP